MATANDIIKIAEKELGTKEYPANSNKQKYGVAYGWNGVPWCVIFIWYLFKEANASDLFYGGNKVASCSSVMSYAQKHNQWITSGYLPGDLVILDFPNTSYETDHIGIVKEVSGKVLITIEGNTSPDDSGSQSNGGMVCQKERSLSLVLGAYRPQYENGVSLTPTKTTGVKSISVTAPEIGTGAKGNAVESLQILLNAFVSAGLDVDGIYGPKTKEAIKAYQSLYPSKCGKADGICGKNTWNCLLY